MYQYVSHPRPYPRPPYARPAVARRRSMDGRRDQQELVEYGSSRADSIDLSDIGRPMTATHHAFLQAAHRFKFCWWPQRWQYWGVLDRCCSSLVSPFEDITFRTCAIYGTTNWVIPRTQVQKHTDKHTHTTQLSATNSRKLSWFSLLDQTALLWYFFYYKHRTKLLREAIVGSN